MKHFLYPFNSCIYVYVGPYVNVQFVEKTQHWKSALHNPRDITTVLHSLSRIQYVQDLVYLCCSLQISKEKIYIQNLL